jgi:hypothetical protein
VGPDTRVWGKRLRPLTDLEESAPVQVLPTDGASDTPGWRQRRELTIGGVFDAVISTFDGLNYLGPDELGTTFSALGRRLRPGGWLVFDLHTDAMMRFTVNHPVVEGQSDGRRFVISSVVDVTARTCNTRIVMTRTDDGDTFSEQHAQHFFTDAEVREALAAARFELVAITDEYTHTPADRSSLRATWTARRRAG